MLLKPWLRKLAFLITIFMVRLAIGVDVVHDVGVTQIIAPVGTVHEGITISPVALVRNFGIVNESFSMTFEFDDYTSTQEITDLNPGVTATIYFDGWTASEPGNYNTKVYTQLNEDQNEDNDTMRSSFQINENLHDVRVASILVPAGMITQGLIVTPIATVENLGTETESFDVTFTFNDYTNTKEVAGVNPGATATIYFDNWTAEETGIYATTIYTKLDTDENGTNDTLHNSFDVVKSLHDVGVTVILVPMGEISQGMEVIPSASIRNFGTETESFDVMFEIDGYSSRRGVTDLEPGEIVTVTFDNWTAEDTGTFPMTVYTKLDGDEIPANDAIHDLITVKP